MTVTISLARAEGHLLRAYLAIFFRRARQRAARLVYVSDGFIAVKIGYAHKCVVDYNIAEHDETSARLVSDQERMTAVGREGRELQQANELLRGSVLISSWHFEKRVF
ncbi:MAG: hypothetical protein JNN30_06155 [Rhodanobacteraceae bacterium]|nr:hypothetical protein [Rhodanobacteraceae bacterium]